MFIKTDVTAEEKSLIQAKARANGQSVSGYLRSAALGETEKHHAVENLLRCAEALSATSQRIQDLATHTIAYKAICGTELRHMLTAVTRMESEMADLLRSTNDLLPRR